MNFYIADIHLAHKNVIKYDGRPFPDCDAMLEALVRNWNNTVSPDDDVYILGDLTWKNSVGLDFLSRTTGRKYLVLGNHDKPTAEMMNCLQWVKDYAVIKDGESEVVLFHYPTASWYDQFRGSVHLYGHVHDNLDYKAYLRYLEICDEMGIPHECYNVGCMMPYMDYTPRSLAEIRRSHGLFQPSDI